MPRGIDLCIPFASRISPDVARARSVHLRWPRRFGLLETTRQADRHARADYAGLAARFHPAATGADLDLGVDQMSWYFIFDDLFDGSLGEDPHSVRQLTEAVARTLTHRPGPSAEPIVNAFADLWERSCEGMSGTWRNRAARHWRAYLSGYVTEARNRRDAVHLTVEEHLRLRRDTIGVQPTVDLAERLGHYEIPQQLFASQHLTAMRHIAAEVDSLHNDICSVEKEEAIGDPHNLLLIIEREQGCDRFDAVATICRMIKERTERFVVLRSEIPALCADHHLSLAQCQTVERYVADALCTVMRGDYDWAEQSGRYDVQRPTAGWSHTWSGR